MDKTIKLTPRQSAKLHIVCEALKALDKGSNFKPDSALSMTYWNGLTLEDVYKQLLEQMK